MKKYGIGIFLIIVLAISYCFTGTENNLLLDKAIKDNIISFKALGYQRGTHYTLPIEIEVKNNSKKAINLEVPSGTMFIAEDSAYQNMLVTKTEVIALNPGKTKTVPIHGMCTEHSDIAPGPNNSYTYSGTASNNMIQLARFIETNNYFDPTGQDAVWCIANNLSLDNIAFYDSKQWNAITDFLSKLTGKKKPTIPDERNYERNWHSTIVSIPVTGSIHYKYPIPKNLHVALFDKNNVIVRELYKEDNAVGEKTIPYQFDAKIYTDEYYFIKLIVDGEVWMQQKREYYKPE